VKLKPSYNPIPVAVDVELAFGAEARPIIVHPSASHGHWTWTLTTTLPHLTDIPVHFD